MQVSRWLISCFFVCSVFASSQMAATTLVFSSNLPDILIPDDQVNLSHLSGYVKSLKQQREHPVLFIHGGDSLFPSALSHYDYGAHMIDILNHMQVDLFAVNQREFAKGLDQLTLRSNEARFPMVLSNIKDKRTKDNIEGILPYFILTSGEMNLGFMMLLDHSLNQTYLKGDVEVDDIGQTITHVSQALKSKGANKLILVTENNVMEQIDNGLLAGFDLVLVAKEGKDYVDVSYQPTRVYSGGHDGELALIHFDDNSDQLDIEVVNYQEFNEDKVVYETIQRYLDRLNIILDYELATLATPLNSSRSVIRTREAAIGNLFADAIREYSGADFSIINSGSIRGYQEYQAGQTIKRANIKRELPFGDNIYTIEVNADDIYAMMENSLSQIEGESGRFLQISGFKVKYDMSRQPNSRVIEIRQAGKPLEDKIYTLSLSGYLLNGGDEYDEFIGKKESYTLKETRLLWTIVSDYIETLQEVAAVRDGRLEDVTP